MERHVTILGAFHIAFGAIGLVAALAILLIFGGAAGLIGLGAAVGSRTPGSPCRIVGIVGTLLMMIVLTLSVPGIAAGFGLMTYRPWARMLTVVLSLLHLLNFPFGSAWASTACGCCCRTKGGSSSSGARSTHRLRRQRLRAAERIGAGSAPAPATRLVLTFLVAAQQRCCAHILLFAQGKPA